MTPTEKLILENQVAIMEATLLATDHMATEKKLIKQIKETQKFLES